MGEGFLERVRAAGCLRDLPLAQSMVDLDVASRPDEHLIERLLNTATTRVMLVNHGLIAVARDVAPSAPAALACADDPAAPRPDACAPAAPLAPAWLDAHAARQLATCPGALAVYLGRDAAGADPMSYIALDITRTAAHPAGGMGADLDLGGEPACDAEWVLQRYDWVELRSFAPCAGARDVGLATSAVAVCAWHASQRFCPACGSAVRPIWSGWAQRCTNPDDVDRMLFPRIEPAVITAIVDDDDRLLLQHNRAWRPGFFSVSAGFVEAGESLERAVRREAAEEVGVAIDEVVYLGSQPWPFPASIMLGFCAHAVSSAVQVDHDEVESARWFTRDELADAVASGAIEPPGRASIARHMIEWWLGAPLS